MRFYQVRHFFTLATSALFLSFLITSLGAEPIEAATVAEQLDETYPLALDGKLALDNVNGAIEVSVWDRSEVRIRAQKRVRAASRSRAEAALEDLRIKIQQESGSIRVETAHPKSSGFWEWLSNSHVSAQVDYQLTVPRRAALDLVTVNGKVTGRGPLGKLSVRTTNGNVEIEGGGGQANVRTTNGSIRIELEEVAADSKLSFLTTNGGIRLSLPSNVRASVEASTTNGSITSEFPVESEGRMSRRRMHGRINGGGGLLALRTTNGSIRISAL